MELNPSRKNAEDICFNVILLQNVSALLSLSVPGAKCERLVNYIRKENAFTLR